MQQNGGKMCNNNDDDGEISDVFLHRLNGGDFD
jgi:hypothetical protein